MHCGGLRRRPNPGHFREVSICLTGKGANTEMSGAGAGAGRLGAERAAGSELPAGQRQGGLDAGGG